MTKCSILSILFLLAFPWPVQAQGETASGSTLVIARIEDDATSLVASKMLAEIYADIGVTIRFEDFSARRALKQSSNGHTDGETMRIAGLGAKFEQLHQIAVPLLSIEGRIYAKNALPNFKSLKELSHMEIGVVRGILVDEEKTKGMKQRFASGIHPLFNQLKHDRIEIVLTDNLTAAMEIAAHFPDSGIRPQGPVQYSVQLYHYLHRKHSKTAEILAAHMLELSKTGQMDQIFAHSIRDVVHQQLPAEN